MDAAELRKARDEILAVHVDAENRGDADAVIATFKHPRYERVPVGEIFDGEAEVRRYYREKEARGRRRLRTPMTVSGKGAPCLTM
jgi:hypothetical protein